MPPFQVLSGDVALHVECDDFTDPWRAAPTLLLIPGFGRTARTWYPLVPLLARHMRVLRMDLRGLGGSGRNFDALREITLERYVEDVAAVVAHCTDGPLHLCGESIGGIVAAGFAARHPAHTASLTLVSSPARLRPEAREKYSFGHGSPAQAMQALGTAEWLRRTNGNTRFPPDMNPEFLDWFNAEVAGADPQVLLGMSDFILHASLEPLLGAITAPTLLIYPQGGSTASDDQCDLLLRAIPDARAERIATPCHMVHLIDPEACAGHIRRFVAAQSRG